ncbi:hypothetical protein C0J52_25377 [Blattella germanica]|nr:hypothetical protein C0J52_25377 [Blattella germanica]
MSPILTLVTFICNETVNYNAKFGLLQIGGMNNQHEGLEVVEAGRALKVQTDAPHLVSLGGGRLSTAVTLHPLPPGRVTIGAARDADIVLQGTGVEPLHCHIENSNGVVTLYPLAEMTSVDGLKVTIPTRLTQGCMLCIGRSNYLRFNHPAEARLMKSILPNTRISMAPLSLFQGSDVTDSALERKPPMAPRRSPRDSWGEMSTSSSGGERVDDSKVLRYELTTARLQHLSPKVFPAGSPTANSPASAVLGPNRASPIPHTNGINPRNTPPLSIPHSNGVTIRSRSGTPTNMSPLVNGGMARSATPVFSSKPIPNRTPVGISRSVTSSPAFDRSIQGSDRSMGSTRSLSGCNDTSSSFNRTTDQSMGSSPAYTRLATPSPAFNRNPLPYSPVSAFRSVTPSPPRSASVGPMSTPAQEARLKEQEAEKQERARLEEILNMCAEYERQVQCERQSKPPPTPTLHQNRIKTNGSLPRDKRLASPSATAEDEIAEIFTFETNTSVIGSFSLNYSSMSTASPVHQQSSVEMAAQDTVSSLPPNMIRSPYENVLIPAPGTVVHPQSPRTRIRTIAPSANKTVQETSSETTQKKTEPNDKGKFILPLENGSPEEPQLNDLVDAMVISNKQVVNGDGESKQKQDEEGQKTNSSQTEPQQQINRLKLDIERALLEGEWQAQNEKLMQEEERLSILRVRVEGLDEEMEQCRSRQLQRQDEAKWRLELREKDILSMEQELTKAAASGNSERHREIADKLRQQHEMLEAERKAFEDLEFRQLEEEAGWLAGREELQRELVDMAARVEVRSLRLRELEQQRLEAAQSAQEESRAMERQLLTYLRRLEEGVLNVVQEQSTSKRPSSQDDLDRISRVTSGAPIEIGTGSLGRRTVESLQEIERNRQRHLVQQGNLELEDAV